VARAVVRFPADSSAVYIHFQACYLVPKEDDWLGALSEPGGDNSVGDNANCHRILDDCNKESVADDTRCSADGKGFPIRPKRCDCSSTGAMTNSIPNPSIPMAGSPSEFQAELEVRSLRPRHWQEA
jgi:hypothetical protein